MFKPASLQRDYTICSQYDSALDLPVVPEKRDDETAEDAAIRAAVATERAEKLRIARERSDWTAITRIGGKPTLFQCRHIPGSDVDWWHGQRERLGDVESQALLFRLALNSIENFGGHEFKHEYIDGHRVAPASTLDILYALDENSGIGRKVVGELAGVVAEKTFARLSPKS